MPNPACRLLPWDSEFFGKRIARIAGDVTGQDEMNQILSWCRSEEVDCLYYLCPADKPGAVHLAENQGFHLVDIRAELSVLLAGQTPAGDGAAAGHVIRRSTVEDLEALTALAEKAFSNTRFSNDPEFGAEAAARLYREWIRKNFESQAATVLVSIHDSKLCGFISFEPVAGDAASIGLIAVDDAMRGRGVGRSLVDACKDHCRRAGHRELRVVTQASNTPALRLYEETGFRLSSIKLWYHKWFSVRSAASSDADLYERTATEINQHEAQRIDHRA